MSIRHFLVVVPMLLLAACGQKMADMPRVDPLDTTPLFDDGTGARTPVSGTVATDDAAAAVPPLATLDVIQKGRAQFDVFCSPCHDYTGHGHGMVVQRGFPAPPDFHSPILLAAPDRHYYDVITNGYGAMYSYADRVSDADRWAIVAYVRALQFSEQVPAAQLTATLRSRLDGNAR
jgi:mono/diheme cytochrome c family protein